MFDESYGVATAADTVRLERRLLARPNESGPI